MACVACAFVVERRRRKAQRWQSWAAICNYIEAFRHASDITVDVARGIKAYIAGDTAEVPRSLVQALQLAASKPVVQAVTQAAGNASQDHGSSTVSAIIDATLSERGQNLLALVASVSTTRAASIMCAQLAQSGSAGNGSHDRAITWLSTPAAQQLISRSIVDFVTAGVGRYCTDTIHINPYEQMLQAASQPRHARVLQELAHTACSASVTAYMQSGSSGRTASGEAGTENHGSTCAILDGTAQIQHIAADSKQVHADRCNGKAQQCLHNTKQSGSDSWMQSWATACRQPAFREMCAASAQRASTGAMQAVFAECKQSGMGRAVSQPYIKLMIAAGLVLWLIVLPIVLVYTMLDRASVV